MTCLIAFTLCAYRLIGGTQIKPLAVQDTACSRHIHRSGSWVSPHMSPPDKGAIGWGGQSINSGSLPCSPSGFSSGRGRSGRHVPC